MALLSKSGSTTNYWNWPKNGFGRHCVVANGYLYLYPPAPATSLTVAWDAAAGDFEPLNCEFVGGGWLGPTCRQNALETRNSWLIGAFEVFAEITSFASDDRQGRRGGRANEQRQKPTDAPPR